MYCSSCGTAVNQGLSYCNYCGAELNRKPGGAGPKLSETTLESLVWAIVAVTVVGLGVVIGLMAVMKEVLHFNEGLIIAFSLLSFLSFLGIDCVFIWVLLRLRIGDKEAGGVTQQKGISTTELGDTKARMLPEPLLSVTEHTTRTLDPVESKRQTE
jgi:hypothetical protein